MSAITEQRIRHLPAVSDGALLGIVSIGDVVKRRVAEIQDEAPALGDRFSRGRCRKGTPPARSSIEHEPGADGILPRPSPPDSSSR